MRGLVFVLMGIVLSVLAGVAAGAADLADAPPVHVGDVWKYRQVDDFTGEIKFEFVHRVVDVSSSEILVKETIKSHNIDRLKVFDRFWNIVDDGTLKFEPPGGIQTFPIPIGRTLRKEYTGTVLKTGLSAVCTKLGKYVVRETVTVPAGTFDTVRLEAEEECRMTDASATIIRSLQTAWYAPGVNRWVRTTSQKLKDGRVRERISTELAEYSLTH